MKNRTHTLRFRLVNRDIFDAIKNGGKSVETRAATKKYFYIKAGDEIRFVCGKQEFTRIVKNAKIFKTISALLKGYSVQEIIPCCKDKIELERMYHSFPGYRQKIKDYGLIAFELG